LPVSNSKAYVSDLYANKIYIVNIGTNEIVGNIPFNGWSEEMTMIYGKVFVTAKQSNFVYVIDASTNNLTDSIAIGYGSNSIVQDINGKLWVLCDGNLTNSVLPSLHQINPLTLSVEQSFHFSNVNDAPWRLKLNGSFDTLYYLNKGVYRMPINASTLPSQAFISSLGNNFYGLGINPANSEIYVSDAIDYVQKGHIYRYKATGILHSSFKAGIIPGDFYFR
jgi:YVTN family beta-propeller protein